jgi:hypothetical protein
MVIKGVIEEEIGKSPIASMQVSSDSPGNKNAKYLPAIDTNNKS